MVFSVRCACQSGLSSNFLTVHEGTFTNTHIHVFSTDSAAAMAQGAGGMPEGMNPFSALANLFNGGNGGPYDGSRTGRCPCCDQYILQRRLVLLL
jgi:hypothetical protein